jgi:hypothetical protein
MRIWLTLAVAVSLLMGTLLFKDQEISLPVSQFQLEQVGSYSINKEDSPSSTSTENSESSEPERSNSSKEVNAKPVRTEQVYLIGPITGPAGGLNLTLGSRLVVKDGERFMTLVDLMVSNTPIKDMYAFSEFAGDKEQVLMDLFIAVTEDCIYGKRSNSKTCFLAIYEDEYKPWDDLAHYLRESARAHNATALGGLFQCGYDNLLGDLNDVQYAHCLEDESKVPSRI